jgi:hypothetical protein
VSALNPAAITFPEINVAGLVTLGNDSGFAQKDYSHSLLATLNKTAGKHSFKTGVDARLMYENDPCGPERKPRQHPVRHGQRGSAEFFDQEIRNRLEV